MALNVKRAPPLFSLIGFYSSPDPAQKRFPTPLPRLTHANMSLLTPYPLNQLPGAGAQAIGTWYLPQ